MYMCIHIYVCVCVYSYVNVDVYVNACVYVELHVHVHASVYVYVYPYPKRDMYTREPPGIVPKQIIYWLPHRHGFRMSMSYELWELALLIR